MLRRGLLLGLSAWLFLAAPAAADDASLGRQGETVYPINDNQVWMVAEAVDLRVRSRRTEVEVSFTFRNEGPAREVLMGFPVGSPYREEGRGDPELHEFAAWVDGEPLDVRREKGVAALASAVDEAGRPLDYPEWLTFSVPFGEGETRTVKNRYWASNYYNSIGMISTGYILRTGRVWKGPIGSAVVSVYLDGVAPHQIISARPAAFRWEDDRLVWRLKEFEPDEDVTILWGTRPEEVPPSPELFDVLNQAEWKGGTEGLLILQEAQKGRVAREGAPDMVDLTLAKFEWFYGEKETAARIAARGVEWGVSHPLVPYLAVVSGHRQAHEFLALPDLKPGLLRWLMDRVGSEGSPPVAPALQMDGRVVVEDPDADLARWELKVWLQPDEGLQPAMTLRGPDRWQPDERRQGGYFQTVWGEEQQAVWYRSWAEDSRGHRVDSGLVKLTLRTPAPVGAVPKEPVAAEPLLPVAAPVVAVPPPASPSATLPFRPSPLGEFGPFGWLLLLAVGAGLLVGFLPFWSERN